MMATQDHIEISLGGPDSLAPVMDIMHASFDPVYGEAWTSVQCAAILGCPGVRLLLATSQSEPVGFALTRTVLDETELLLIAVRPEARRHGIGQRLLADIVTWCRTVSIRLVFLEVRKGNPAISLYRSAGFHKVGERRAYYRGADGQLFDAYSYSLGLPY